QDVRRELMQRGTELGPAAAREWGDSEKNHEVRAALNKDLEAFARLYSQRSKHVYAKIEQGIAAAAWLLSLIAAAAVLLAAAGAATASGEASENVRDIASAADELAASVTEIDRQVAQSNAIATKAVSEAEWTNATVKELNEAAGRIGDVVKLITDIAEQTNLL